MAADLIGLFRVHMPPRGVLMPALERVLYSGHVTQGPAVAQFEAAFASWLGAPRALAVNSGTSALQLALRLANISGGEVITTPVTCVATNMPILAEGGRVVWADVDPATGNIDPVDVERKLTDETRAVLAVHWGGQPCDLDALDDITAGHGIPLIEDAAHALGAKVGVRRIGAGTADFTCFSLQAIKHITTVDGGMLTTPWERAHERGKRLRWYGLDREAGDRIGQDAAEYGHKWHMNDVTATIGLAQLPCLDDVLAAHRANAAFYDRALDGRLGTKRPETRARGAWWLYTVLLSDASERAEFMAWMREKGIEVSRVHARNDTHTAFAASRAELPGVDEFCARMCCVPVHSGLRPRERERVAAAMVAFCEAKA
jgi:dTDP-4-amino-4,6-dideoxygalactose transaminase